MRNKPDLADFIKANKPFIDSVIKDKVPNAVIDADERRSWMLNCEELYSWASQFVSDEDEGL